jgi:hypothetical protein
MNYLPNEIILAITLRLTELDKALLSFTCNHLHTVVPRSLSLMEACVIENNYKSINLAKSWGNNWNKQACLILGQCDNLGLFNMELNTFTAEALYWIGYSCKIETSRIKRHVRNLCNTKYASYEEGVITAALDKKDFSALSKLCNTKEKWYFVFCHAVRNRDAAVYIMYIKKAGHYDFRCLNEDDSIWTECLTRAYFY